MSNLLTEMKKRPIGGFGRRAEKEAAKRLGASLTPSSGAVGEQGDFTLGSFQIENKATEGYGYNIPYYLVVQIKRRAGLHGKIPALAIQFVTPQGKLKEDGGWVAVPEEVFKQLQEKFDEQ